MLRIVINAIPLLSPLTGVGVYLNNLITEFKRLRPDFHYSFYYGYFSKKINLYNSEFHHIKEFIKTIPVIASSFRKIKHRLTSLQMQNYDIYFEPNFIPLDIKAKKTITTIHDFSFYLYPEWHPRDRVRYFSENFFRRIKASDIIITPSRYIAQEALEILRIEDDRVITIPHGYDRALFKVAHYEKIDDTLPTDYILFVGSIEPRKNLCNLLKAYGMLPGHIKRDFKLILAGPEGWKNREIINLLKQMRGDVRYLGYTDGKGLVSLYRNARCLVYPSFYEGFGLPPLEAMACGCPVVVSDVASLPEVCGDAAYYVNPYNAESIAEGMEKVLTEENLRQSLIKKGLERVKPFTWERSAIEHIRVFDGIMNG